MCKFSDVVEGLRFETVTGCKLEFLKAHACLCDHLQTHFIQEVATGQLQTHQARAACSDKTKSERASERERKRKQKR